MSGWPCYACGVVVTPSHAAITEHVDGFRHRLRMLGLSADEAERVAQACYEAGISYETARAAIRYAMTRPPGEYARMAAELRGAADKLGEAIG